MYTHERASVTMLRAKARGLRVVPPDPDPAEFPLRLFACDLRTLLCGRCTVSGCPYGVALHAR